MIRVAPVLYASLISGHYGIAHMLIMLIMLCTVVPLRAGMVQAVPGYAMIDYAIDTVIEYDPHEHPDVSLMYTHCSTDSTPWIN